MLKKLVRERDELVARKKARGNQLSRARGHAEADVAREEDADDQLEVQESASVEIEAIREGNATTQDLLTVIKKADLDEALPVAINFLLLAVVTPLTSVHCERVFSPMKRIVSPGRSRMLQQRKYNLVLSAGGAKVIAIPRRAILVQIQRC